MALNKLYKLQVNYCSNRKEAKDHGADKGQLLGAELQAGDKVIIVEDVTTSGKSIDETYPILRSIANVEVIGLVVSFDRMEVGPSGTMSAVDEIEHKYGFPVRSIVNMEEVRKYMEDSGKLDKDILKKIDHYYDEYGVK